MDFTRQLYNYCERGFDGAFWAEPLNAATNAAFVIAGIAALVLLARQPAGARPLRHMALAVLMIVIGTGSFLFHTYATVWAMLADVIPIWIFMLAYLAVALHDFFRLRLAWVVILTAAFAIILWAAGTVQCDGGACMNGSLGYMPAVAALWIIAFALIARRHPAAAHLLLAALVLSVSVSLRTVDRTWCEATVIGGYRAGTHFLWHLLNALTLYILTQAAILHGAPPAARRAKN